MMRQVHLHGALGERFGKVFRLAVRTPAEAFLALSVNLGQPFREAVKAGEWHIMAGPALGFGQDLGDPDMLRFGLGSRDLHIAPAIRGSNGGGGLFKVILGVAIMAAAIWLAPPATIVAGTSEAAVAGGAVAGGLGATAFSIGGYLVSYGAIATSGLVMALGGAAQLITPSPKVGGYGSRETADERPSFLFNGAKNTVEQGGPVPLIYGRMRVGGLVISSGVEVEQI